MSYTLPELTYDYAALEPHYPARLLQLHHDEQHAPYAAMMTSGAATAAHRTAARSTDAGWRWLIEPWTADHPDPAHWLTTVGLESARLAIEDALRAGPDPIVVSGPTGHGKTLLLRSLRTRPPRGFVPMFIPFSNVEPDELAGWILETAKRHRGREPAVELARVLRANVQFDGRTLLLMDEVQATPRATLSKLFEIIAGSRLRVSLVLAGLPGEALDLALTALPHPVRPITVSALWTRADAELLLMQVALTLDVDPTDLVAAVDVDAALTDGAGNPRLVRTALAARIRMAEPFCRRIQPIRRSAPTQSSHLHAPSAPPAFPQHGAAVPLASSGPSAALLPSRPLTGTSPVVPGIIQIRRSAVRRAFRSRTWLGRTVRGVQLALTQAAHALETGHRFVASARGRTSALSASLRAHSVALLRRANAAQQRVRRILRPSLLVERSAFAMAGAVAKLAARGQRGRVALAAALASAGSHAIWALAAAVARFRRSAKPLAFHCRAWIERTARSGHVASQRAARSIRTRGQRMSAARDRTRAVAARLRAASLAHGAAAWSFLHRSTRPPLFAARKALAIAVVAAALATIVADGRAPTPAITEATTGDSEARGDEIIEMIGEPIPFRLNSHPWSTVEIDGSEVGTTPLTIALEPGPHHFRLEMADGRILEKVFVVSALQDRLAFR